MPTMLNKNSHESKTGCKEDKTYRLSHGGAALSFWLRSALFSRSVSSGLWPPSAACCSTPSAPTPRLRAETNSHFRPTQRNSHSETAVFMKRGTNNEPPDSPLWFLSSGSLRPKTSTTFFQFSVSIHEKKKKKTLRPDRTACFDAEVKRDNNDNKEQGGKEDIFRICWQTVSSMLGGFSHSFTQQPW